MKKCKLVTNMTAVTIIIISLLVLVAYIFDITAPKTRIPTVVMLIFSGFGLKYLAAFFKIEIPELYEALPIIGTIGLILIVFEGSLELKITKENVKSIKVAFWLALLAIVLFIFCLSVFLIFVENIAWQNAVLSATTLSIISSAIAIPSVASFNKSTKEFIIYESSYSDIIGVVFFNFFMANQMINFSSIFIFFRDLAIMILISLFATFALTYLLGRIKHHVKFIPIIAIILIIYSIAKIYHLPSLIFIMVFGLSLSNINSIKSLPIFNNFHLNPTALNGEIHKFYDIVVELTFAVRITFFLLFGFLLEYSDIFNAESFVWSAGILLLIYTIRAILLLIFKKKLFPSLFIAPRGLINILLFISIPATLTIPQINKSVMVQVILMTAILIIGGSLTNKQPVENDAK